MGFVGQDNASVGGPPICSSLQVSLELEIELYEKAGKAGKAYHSWS